MSWIFFSTLGFCISWVWTCKWYFALSLLACMSRYSFIVWMIIVVTIYSDCSCLVKPCLIVIFLLLDCIVLAPYAFQDFCLQWSSCVIVVRKTCQYGSRASQNLELGVSEFWQLFPTYILSLESVLGYCHRIAKGGDCCKVEFIQSCVGFILCQICL